MKVKFKEEFAKFFKASPLFRAIVVFGSIIIIIGVLSLIGHGAKKKPVLKEIDPAVGSPGSIMTLTGDNFGDVRDSSYVEVGGSRLTASDYLLWSDDLIKVILPSNSQDGLVLVGTSAGRSEPVFFVNESGIPTEKRPDIQTTLPVIEMVTPSEEIAVGSRISIKGTNFGPVRGDSQVYFTAARDNVKKAMTGNTSLYANPVDLNAEQVEYIPASEGDYDYENWNDGEITMRVPDGAGSGQIYVKTSKGESEKFDLKLDDTLGVKHLNGKRTYIVQVTADVANAVAKDGSTISLYMPRPVVTAAQPDVQLNECFPEPIEKNDRKTVLYQKQLTGSNENSKLQFSQNFLVTVYAITSGLKSSYVDSYTQNSRVMYKKYTSADSCVPSDSPLVRNELAKIIGINRNPYVVARMIYNYMAATYKISDEIRTGDVSVLDLITSHTGDAYDYAMIFTAFCRAAGIPAVPVSGVLVEENSLSRSHWWSEIYFEGYGWFPVDIALGDGLKYKPFTNVGNAGAYYFGNMDSQHIAFSRGWNEIQPAERNSKRVFRPRTYALQSLWEEASAGTQSYSSLWNDPIILGIY